jgi:hypothetical protein
MVGQAPQVGRYPGPEKRRIRGDDAGAEDGEVWTEQVRNGAIERVRVEDAKAAIRWRL